MFSITSGVFLTISVVSHGSTLVYSLCFTQSQPSISPADSIQRVRELLAIFDCHTGIWSIYSTFAPAFWYLMESYLRFSAAQSYGHLTTVLQWEQNPMRSSWREDDSVSFGLSLSVLHVWDSRVEHLVIRFFGFWLQPFP